MWKSYVIVVAVVAVVSNGAWVVGEPVSNGSLFVDTFGLEPGNLDQWDVPAGTDAVFDATDGNPPGSMLIDNISGGARGVFCPCEFRGESCKCAHHRVGRHVE